MSAPTFFVPEEVPHTTRYEYLVTASAADAEDATALVTVTVLDSGVLTLACANPAPVYEGFAGRGAELHDGRRAGWVRV